MWEGKKTKPAHLRLTAKSHMHVVFALIQGNLFQNQWPNSFQNTRTNTAALGLHTHASQHVWALIFAFKKIKSRKQVSGPSMKSEWPKRKDSSCTRERGKQTGNRVAWWIEGIHSPLLFWSVFLYAYVCFWNNIHRAIRFIGFHFRTLIKAIQPDCSESRPWCHSEQMYKCIFT